MVLREEKSAEEVSELADAIRAVLMLTGIKPDPLTYAALTAVADGLKRQLEEAGYIVLVGTEEEVKAQEQKVLANLIDMPNVRMKH